ncbi:MAG: aminopeptidase [Alphaproteobacteria bacterium]|nr:MAG: aminopeptidase [Alphaproteobacteria bacterium]
MFKHIIFFLTILTFLVSLSGAASAKDSHSYANVDAVISTHLHLDLTVDFDRKVLTGFAEYDIGRVGPNDGFFILDTRDLDIHKVDVLDHGWQPTSFELAAADATLGSKLTITLPVKAKKIRIYYTTRPEASGLQWLTPAQTASKKYPFLFTQSEAIHTRSWVPIQDTPALRLTYTAHIRTPENLFAVMSAENDPDAPRDGDYNFTMVHKIPPYLLALGVGDIHFKAMAGNTGIYAEQYILDAAAAEFADTYKMVKVTEKLYGPYRWGRYDILMMPPSYPMGGMENPMLSFITPTVIAGDKSLVDLIAHELAHSWSGNLVTNASWDDVWLNEGMTSYVENRIMEEVYGSARAMMEKTLSAEGLQREMETLDLRDTSLHVDLQGRDPDGAFSNVPYVKGQLFLVYLEEKYGRAAFDPFLKGYFTTHAFQNMTSEKFIAYLKENLMDKHPGVVSMDKIKEWIYGTGMPDDTPNATSGIFAKVRAQQAAWLEGKMTLEQIPTMGWTVHQWLHFITNLPKDMTSDRMAELDRAFDLVNSRNNEIAHAWLLQGLRHGYSAITPRLRSYLPSIGRLKLIKPLYKQMAETPEGLKLAREIYAPARPGYHPSAQKALDKILGE